jgi:hypothetical protein
MADQFKFISKVVYDLKRQFPTEVVFKKFGPTSVDTSTGKVVRSSTDVTIKRGILLPRNLSLETGGRTGSLAYGGGLDITESRLILDKRDIPSTLKVEKKDKIYVGGKDWEIADIEKYADKALLLIIKELD